MKKVQILLLLATVVYLTSCSNSPKEKAKSSVKSYLKESLKNPSSYVPISFSELDTLEFVDTSATDKLSSYIISHFYNITNSDNDRIKMSISFYLDKDFKVTKTKTRSIDGEYGSLTGNVYWKYNDYVGNKPDAGAEITLYSLNTIRENLKFEATADVQGYYKIDKIPPGKYFLIVRSQNTTACPDNHLWNIINYSDYLKQLFGFNIDNYSDKVKKFSKLDSLAVAALSGKKASQALDRYYKYKEQSRNKANSLIVNFPKNFKSNIKLYTGYSNAYDFEIIQIGGNKSVNHITDFGTTCI